MGYLRVWVFDGVFLGLFNGVLFGIFRWGVYVCEGERAAFPVGHPDPSRLCCGSGVWVEGLG